MNVTIEPINKEEFTLSYRFEDDLKEGVEIRNLEEQVDLEDWDSMINAVLELLALAPAFDHLRTSVVETLIGSDLHFSVELDNGETIEVTDYSYHPHKTKTTG